MMKASFLVLLMVLVLSTAAIFAYFRYPTSITWVDRKYFEGETYATSDENYQYVFKNDRWFVISSPKLNWDGLLAKSRPKLCYELQYSEYEKKYKSIVAYAECPDYSFVVKLKEDDKHARWEVWSSKLYWSVTYNLVPPPMPKGGPR